MQNLIINPLGNALGAEVIGLDLNLPIDKLDFEKIHQAHLDYHVLVFRNQKITTQQHVDFSKLFGVLQYHVLSNNFQVKDQPELLIISNILEDGKPIGVGDAGNFWHSDMAYKEKPSMGSMLHAIELPKVGGDTIFANQHRAYEDLPEAVRQKIEGLKAENYYLARYAELQAVSPWRPKLTQAQIDEVKPTVHPVVRTHPESGKKALFVSEHFTTKIVGLPEHESRELLDYLFAFSTRPELQYRHKWQPHDLVFWDNRSVMHLAGGTPDSERRLMYRSTIEGDVPF